MLIEKMIAQISDWQRVSVPLPGLSVLIVYQFGILVFCFRVSVPLPGLSVLIAWHCSRVARVQQVSVPLPGLSVLIVLVS
ncbi:hypothetical protein NIES2104_08460 [Leptolyngbya sp. NIES-2104]|nr:hypothetical protein NIES2104_08460 [Leptolyngbya sp. NIES-2104]